MSRIDQKLIDPENMKIFEKVMPHWYKRIMETQTRKEKSKVTIWEELNLPTYCENEGVTQILDIGQYSCCMVGEICGFESDYIAEYDEKYDTTMLEFANTFINLIERGFLIEWSGQTKGTKAKLEKIRTTFSEKIDECMNYLKEKYPEKCGITSTIKEIA